MPPSPVRRPRSELSFSARVCRAISVAVILLASALNLLSTLQIEKFRQIFADALPGQHLPALTLLVLAHPQAWPIIALGITSALLWCLWKTHGLCQNLLVGFLSVAILAQILITFDALAVPMTGNLITGRSPSTSSG